MSADMGSGGSHGGGLAMVRTSRLVATVVAAASLVGLSAVPSSAASDVTGPVLVARASGLSVFGTGFLAVASVPGIGDTGPIITQSSGEHGPECGVAAPSAVVSSATAICGGAVTVAPGAAAAVAWVDDLTMGIPGAPPISLIGVRSVSSTTCTEGPKASSKIGEVNVGGMPVSVAPGPNTKVVLFDKGGISVVLIADERLTGGPGIGVTAARVLVRLAGGHSADVKIGSSASGALNCGG